MALSSPSVLLVRLDAIGDALAMTPLVEALRERDIPVSAVLRPVNAHAFAKGTFAETIVANFRQRDESAENRRLIAAAAGELRGRFTHALIATEDPAGYRLAYAAGIRNRIGFENGWGKPLKTLWVRRLCTQTVYRTAGLDPRAPHECRVIFELGRTLLNTDAQPTRDVDVLRRLVVDGDVEPDARIALQVTDKWERLGASLGDLVELARRMAARRTIRYIASAAENAFAERFRSAAGVEVESFEALAPWKFAIASAKALVAPDSGALHVAGMTGTPTIAAYQPVRMFASQTARWAPWAAPYRRVAIEDAWQIVAADALEDLLSGSRAVYTG